MNRQMLRAMHTGVDGCARRELGNEVRGDEMFSERILYDPEEQAAIIVVANRLRNAQCPQWVY